MHAGAMNFRVAFDAPVRTPNGQGGTTLGWAQAFSCFAEIIFLRGGETVQAARLQGRQPIVAKVHSSAMARSVETDWRMRDLRSGVIYAIHSIVPSDNRAHLELTCESGAQP
jgi:SPP1 family predicted phage head-tail adaptor